MSSRVVMSSCFMLNDVQFILIKGFVFSEFAVLRLWAKSVLLEAAEIQIEL